MPRLVRFPDRLPWNALLLALVSLQAAQAQTTTLHTFTDGGYSTANLVQTADGTLYSVTRSRGGATNGRVIKLQPDGSGYQVVHTFTGTASEPDHSFILGRDGAFYGTGEFGGTANFGMLYKVNPDGSGFALLRSFTAGVAQRRRQRRRRAEGRTRPRQ